MAPGAGTGTGPPRLPDPRGCALPRDTPAPPPLPRTPTPLSAAESALDPQPAGKEEAAPTRAPRSCWGPAGAVHTGPGPGQDPP